MRPEGERIVDSLDRRNGRTPEQIFEAQVLIGFEGGSLWAYRSISRTSMQKQVDRPGVSAAVGKGSAYDLFLTCGLYWATMVGTLSD